MDFKESRINPLSILEEVSVLGSCFLSEIKHECNSLLHLS